MSWSSHAGHHLSRSLKTTRFLRNSRYYLSRRSAPRRLLVIWIAARLVCSPCLLHGPPSFLVLDTVPLRVSFCLCFFKSIKVACLLRVFVCFSLASAGIRLAHILVSPWWPMPRSKGSEVESDTGETLSRLDFESCESESSHASP